MTALAALPRQIIWLLGLSLWLAGTAFAANPFARATLTTKAPIYAGQQIEVDVDVFVPNYFLSPPQFPLFDLPGTVVTMPDERGMNLNETVNGEAFSGIRKTYAITPQAAGDYVLPPAVIPFGYAAVPGQMSKGQVTLPSLKFTVEAVPQGAGGEAGVTAGEITLTQSFDRDPAGLKAGDALVRTITIRAAGLAPMMIPEPTFDAPADVQLYRHDPVLSEERTSRGDITAGLRKDVATYVFAMPGTYALPAISLPWFDPASGSTQTAEAAGVTVNVNAAPAAAPALAPPAPPPAEEPFDWLWWLGIAASIAALATLIQLAANLFGRLETRLETALEQRAQSEATAFCHVLDACRDHDPMRLETALDHWSRRTGNTPLSRWLDRFADPATANAFADYRRSRYGSGGSHQDGPDRLRLRGGLKVARQRWLSETSADGGGPTSDLPDLNPGLEAAPPRRFGAVGRT